MGATHSLCTGRLGPQCLPACQANPACLAAPAFPPARPASPPTMPACLPALCRASAQGWATGWRTKCCGRPASIRSSRQTPSPLTRCRGAFDSGTQAAARGSGGEACAAVRVQGHAAWWWCRLVVPACLPPAAGQWFHHTCQRPLHAHAANAVAACGCAAGPRPAKLISRPFNPPRPPFAPACSPHRSMQAQ